MLGTKGFMPAIAEGGKRMAFGAVGGTLDDTRPRAPSWAGRVVIG